MCIDTELDKLKGWIEHLPRIGMQAIGGDGQPMYVLDLIMIGAIKRSLSLASGLQALVASRNMTCSTSNRENGIGHNKSITCLHVC
ncbi:hypothetical protein OGZ01_10885 [Vibrio harveyi]|nr:hypothetical protein [Vibrio harveyi]